jgi:hypothetical protein
MTWYEWNTQGKATDLVCPLCNRRAAPDDWPKHYYFGFPYCAECKRTENVRAIPQPVISRDLVRHDDR